MNPDAREVELTVPYVFVEDTATIEVIPLPVTDPISVQIGPYPVRITRSALVEGNPRERTLYRQQPALRLDLDLGGWHDDRRMLLPGMPILDGDSCNSGYRIPGMLDSRRPEPVDRLDIVGARALTAKTLGFRRPRMQVRGPWRIRFAIG